jgi:hypothetical protein
MRTLAITLWFPDKCLSRFMIFEKQLASQNIFLLLCVTFFLCMDLQPYSHDCYSKILETILIGFFILEKKLANIPLFLFLINSLLLYIPLLALTDRQTDRDSNTLALRGLVEPFFQLCCCFSFLSWQKIDFGFTYYLCT